MNRLLPLSMTVLLSLAHVAALPASAEEAVGELKNVQKFKGLSKPELVKIMKTFNAALGVKCDHCHVKGDFPSDEKDHKRAARMMIDMVNTLNEKYFSDPKGDRATCFMCHRGAEKPVFAP